MSTGSMRSVSMIGGCSVTCFPYSLVRFKIVYAVRLTLGHHPQCELPLDIEESHVAGVALDEAAPALDVLTHENREDLVCGRGVVQRDLEKDAVVRVQRGLPQLLVVHLTQTLVALDAGVLGQPPSLTQPGLNPGVAFAVGVGVFVRVVAPLETEERRLGEVDEAGLDERLLDVEDLAADRQDRLVVRVTASNRGTTRGVTLDDEDLTDRGVAALAVAKLARQSTGLEQTLTARGLACLTGRHPCRSRLHGLTDDVLPLVGVGA